MKLFFFLAFLALSDLCRAQLAKLTHTDEQEYIFNVNRGGPKIGTPFSKPVISVSISGEVEDNAGGYLYYTLLQGDGGAVKKGPYLHFTRMDSRFNSKLETDTYLLDGDEAVLEPLAVYKSKDVLNIIMASKMPSSENSQLTYWQISLNDLSVLKKNIPLTSLPIMKDRLHFTRFYEPEDGQNFGLTILEESFKKDPAVLHCISFNKDLALQYKYSVELPFTRSKGRIVNSVMNAAGTLCVLVSHPDEKKDEVWMNTLLLFSKEKQQMQSLAYNGETLINGYMELANNGEFMIAGLKWPAKKNHTPGLVMGKISASGKLIVSKEELFSEEVLKKLNKADKKGLETNYWVRSISERENGTVDVIITYASHEESTISPSLRNTTLSDRTTEIISDAILLSYQKNNLQSTLFLKRNLENNTARALYQMNLQSFSVPMVFTRDNDLFLIYFDNPENQITSTGGDKPRRADFTEGTLMLARIDKNFKPVQQELVRFDRDGNFSSFYEMTIKQLGDKKILLRTDKHRVFTKKVKTSSVLVEIK